MPADPGKPPLPARVQAAPFNRVLIFILLFFAVWTALSYVLPVGQEDVYLARALQTVAPFVTGTAVASPGQPV